VAVNVQQPDGLRVFAKAKNPITSALAGIFTVPSDDAGKLAVLLKSMEKPARK
jgi:hypothetical protein